MKTVKDIFMKYSLYLFMIVLLLSACNSYDHEAYIAQFKANFDNKINNFDLSEADSARILSNRKQTIEEFKVEKIANDRFYIDNYSWYQLGKNLILSPAKAKEEAIKYGFNRPYYFLQFLKNDTTTGPAKSQVIGSIRNRLYKKHNRDSAQIFACSSSDLFRDVKRYERSKYFFFIKVDFEKVKNASDRQKKVAGQMFQGALKRLLAKTEVKDNLYHITITKGEEIGISEELFTIGKGMLDDSNKDFLMMREKHSDYAMNLDPKQTRLVRNDWNAVYSLYKRYIKQ